MLKRLIVDPRIRAKHADLIETPVIIRLNKGFNEEMGEKFYNEMNKAHETGQTVIPVIVDSYGGAVDSLMDMIHMIQTSKLPVATIVLGKAMSAGAMLFGFGSPGYRYIAENARIMIHDVSSGTWGKVEEMKADAKETDRLNTLIFTMLAKHLGKKDNYFLDILHDKGHAEWYLNAKEARKHGLANHIGIPELVAEVSVSYKFGIEG